MESAHKLTNQERELLLQTARRTLEEHLRHGRKLATEAASPALQRPRGAFVTLRKAGQLRGCIGTFEAEGPLLQTVQRMAVSAATSDPRFPTVRDDELAELELEISVLSPLQKVSAEEIMVGVHGVFITRGFHRGVLLPQVATENNWDRETFLDHTCIKAGLPSASWREPGVTIEAFSAEVFGEEDMDQGK